MGEVNGAKKVEDRHSHSTTSSEVRRLSHETKSTVSNIIRSEEVRMKAKEEALQAIEILEKVDSKMLLARAQKANHYISLENKVLGDHLLRIMARTGHQMETQLEALKEISDEDSEDNESVVGKSRDGTSYSGRSRIWPKSSLDYSPADSFTKPNIVFKRTDKQSSSGSKSKGYQSSLRSSIGQKLDPHRPLDSEEKCDIVSGEIKLLKGSIKEASARSGQILDDLRAMFVETCIKVGEIRRDKSDYYRDVVSDMEKRKSGKACAEGVLRFLKDKMEAKKIQINKMKEQNEVFQLKTLDLEELWENKVEISEVLHAVDFDRFKIQNQQLATKLSGKSREYSKLKSNYFKASRAMANARNQLSHVDHKNWSVHDSLALHAPHLQHIVREVSLANTKKKFLLDDLHMLAVQEIHGAGQPNGLEYMQIRIKAADLQKSYIDWKRKVELAKLTAHELGRKLQKLLGHHEPKKVETDSSPMLLQMGASA